MIGGATVRVRENDPDAKEEAGAAIEAVRIGVIGTDDELHSNGEDQRRSFQNFGIRFKFLFYFRDVLNGKLSKYMFL